LRKKKICHFIVADELRFTRKWRDAQNGSDCLHVHPVLVYLSEHPSRIDTTADLFTGDRVVGKT